MRCSLSAALGSLTRTFFATCENQQSEHLSLACGRPTPQALHRRYVLFLPITAQQAMHKQSLEEPDKFWGDAARSTLKWFRDFDRVSQGGFEAGDVAWFTGGQLNACYNCIDQHLPQRAKQVSVGVVRYCAQIRRLSKPEGWFV